MFAFGFLSFSYITQVLLGRFVTLNAASTWRFYQNFVLPRWNFWPKEKKGWHRKSSCSYSVTQWSRRTPRGRFVAAVLVVRWLPSVVRVAGRNGLRIHLHLGSLQSHASWWVFHLLCLVLLCYFPFEVVLSNRTFGRNIDDLRDAFQLRDGVHLWRSGCAGVLACLHQDSKSQSTAIPFRAWWNLRTFAQTDVLRSCACSTKCVSFSWTSSVAPWSVPSWPSWSQTRGSVAPCSTLWSTFTGSVCYPTSWLQFSLFRFIGKVSQVARGAAIIYSETCDTSRHYNIWKTRIFLFLKETIMLVVWGLIFVGGIAFQLYREWGRPHFPPRPRKAGRGIIPVRVSVRTSSLDPDSSDGAPPPYNENEDFDERTPLLLPSRSQASEAPGQQEMEAHHSNTH